MTDFLRETFSNPDTFWTALESIATVIAALFIFYELPRMRRDNASKKVEGLRFAIEQLNEKDFRTRINRIYAHIEKSSNYFPDEALDDLIIVLGRLDFVGQLVNLGYVDKELLFYMFADDFWYLNKALSILSKPPDTQIPKLKARNPRGYALLEEGSNASMKEFHNWQILKNKFTKSSR